MGELATGPDAVAAARAGAPGGDGGRSRAAHATARAARALVLLLLALQLGTGLFVQARHAYRFLERARSLRRESLPAARLRALGEGAPDYAAGLADLEAALPGDAEYVLLDLDRSGTVVLLQGDLAPRRALLLADERALHARWRRRAAARGLPARTVLFRGLGQRPRLVATADVVARGAAAW